jgi:hypothetical protein
MTFAHFRAAASFSSSPDAVGYTRHAVAIGADVPFNYRDPMELQLRSARVYAASFKCPVRIYYGADETHFALSSQPTAKLAREHGLDVQSIAVDGGHNGSVQESGEVRILRGFLKGVHLSRITGSQIHPVRNATKPRACCGNDAPRAENGDTDCKVLALPSKLGNPHRTRVPTFPQQRLRRRTNLPKLQNPPKSQGLTDSCAEP